jgi:hypothetical protein
MDVTFFSAPRVPTTGASTDASFRITRLSVQILNTTARLGQSSDFKPR